MSVESCCLYNCWFFVFFFFMQKTAYEMRISDWSSRRVLFRSSIAKRLKQHCVTVRPFNEMTAPGSWSWSIPKHGLLIGLRLPYFPPAHLVRRHGPANICASLATARLLSFELGPTGSRP